MNWLEVWDVLKWILAALAAGFIGQFGKSLALHFMKRRRRGQASKSSTESAGASTMDANQAKIEKKKAKAQVKRLKKT